MFRLFRRALAATGLAIFMGVLGAGLWLNRAEAAGAKTVTANDTITCAITGEQIAPDDCPAPCTLCP